MENLGENRPNIDLIWTEQKEPINMAKFIVSHTYYYLQNFYQIKLFGLSSNNFEKYLDTFKKNFKKKDISTKFYFDLLNKSYEEKTPIDNNNNDISIKECGTNEKMFYEIQYKKFINIINNHKYSKDEQIIESFISIRNCFIFLEYLYLFLKTYPDKISHYLIKINISFLLYIPEKSAKRLLDSDEYFYHNLIELKGVFGDELNYIPSSFINNIDKEFYFKYSENIKKYKKKKLNTLQVELNNLYIFLGKFNEVKNSYLMDYIKGIYNSLSNDIYNNSDLDDLIFKYITEQEKNENKNYYQILNEINEEGNIPKFNYLYLLALNSLDELIKNNNNEKNKKNIGNLNNEEIIQEKEIDNKKLSNELNEGDINKFSKVEVIKVDNQQLNENNKKEKIIKIEELRKEIKRIEEKEISELEFEEFNEENDIYANYIKKNFLYNKIFNIKKDNIYNILCFLNCLNDTEKINSENIDDVYIEYKNKFIASVKNLYPLDYNYFYDLILDKEFYDEIIAILKSKSIIYYINNNRFFNKIDEDNKDKKEYEFEFTEKGKPYHENLSKEYEIFMNKMENSAFFINLFRLKYLPLGIRAITNFNLKIIINSLYYEFNDNISDINKKIILKAAFKILIIHEIMHILKYLKNDVNFNDIPYTPRGREGGKMRINYLFGKPTIKRIILQEAIKINNIKNWENVNYLREIFPAEEILTKKDEEIFKKNIDHIDLYFTGDELDDEIKSDNIDIDIDIDID